MCTFKIKKTMENILKRIGQFFSRLFKDGFGFLRNNSIIAVKVTNTFKEIVESPATSLVVDWTKTGIDDALLPHVITVANKAAAHVAIAHNILQVDADDSDVVEKLLAYLKTLNKDARVAFWLTISGKLNEILSDGKITFAESVALAQMVYVEIK